MGDVPETRDPYQILQLHPSAVPEMVEAAYRTLARLHHPDHNDEPQAGSAMADLNWAYATLREPSVRAAYDRTRVAIPVAADAAETQPAVASASLSQRVAMAAEAAAGRDGGNPANVILDFGRYAGMTLREIARIEPGTWSGCGDTRQGCGTGTRSTTCWQRSRRMASTQPSSG